MKHKTEQVSFFDIPHPNENIMLHIPNNKKRIKAMVSWSGGKDSTATAILAINDGYEVYMCHSFVEFYPGIPFVTKRMVDFIYRAKETFESYGAKVEIIKPISYWERCHHILEKSPFEERNGRMQGYPCPCRCNFQQYFKSFPLGKWQDSIDADVCFLGICYDEDARKGQLTENKRSLLNERKYTQVAARQICEQNGLLSPVYTNGDRDGCGLCYNAKPEQIKEWLNDYPEALPILRDLDAELKEKAIFGNRWGRNGITLHDIGIL